MKTVKWLFALFFALSFTLAVEFVGAFAVIDGLTWYDSLNLPLFVTGKTAHSVLWCVVYALEACVIGGLLVGNRFKPFIYEYLSIKLLCAVWTAVFFDLKSTFLSLVVITVILTLNFVFCRNLLKIKAHPYKIFVFLPVLIWYSYLWIVNYCIVMMN